MLRRAPVALVASAALLAGVAPAAGQDLDHHPDAPRLEPPRLLVGEPPPYPDGATDEARVVVSLLVDEQGRVAEAEVAEPAGEPFDAAVLAQVRGFRFSPATSDGEAIRARIRLAFTFAPPTPGEPAPEAGDTPTDTGTTGGGPAEGVAGTSTVTSPDDEEDRGPVPPDEPAGAGTEGPTGLLAGQVFERGTRDILADARAEAAGELAFVDAEGRFELRLPEGTHELLVVQEGYSPLRTAVEIEDGMRLELALRLERERGSRPFETTIHGRRDEEEVTRVSLAGEEIHNLPGTMGDPFRAIEALPGITPVLTGLPYYFVRGAPPSGTGFYLDGVRVPALFHLALGPAVVHPSLVERIDFFPGGAPADLGRYVGGMVRAETRLPRADHWRLEWDLRLTDVGALVEVPITDDLRVSASGRYSYTGWLIKLFEEDAYLQYWDYQGRLEWDFAPGHRLVLFGFGSFDQAGEEEDDGTIEGPKIQFHRVDLRYLYRHGRELRAELAGWFGYDATTMDEEDDVGLTMWAGGPRATLVWSPEEWLDVAAGTDLEVRHFPPPGLEEEDDLTPLTRERDAVLLGTWAKVTLRPTEDTDLQLGGRFDVHRVADDTESWFDVRLTLRHRLTDWLWLKGSMGTFHQPQSFVIDLPGLGSFVVDSGPQRSYQLSQGVEIALPWELGLDVQAYYSDFANLSDPDIPDDGDVFEGLARGLFEPLDGRAYGLELLLRRHLGAGVFGWIAYTLARSERDYEAGTATADFDQTHVLNLVLSWDVGRGWRIGGRFHLRSGRPYTPLEWTGRPGIEGSCRVSGGRNTERLPPFYRLDLRVDKKWTFETWWFALYFEFINITFTAEPLSMECNWEEPHVRLEEVPYIVIPTLGFRGVY
ncbi:MAG: TonB-dependent receptor [Deltaproteobacteria bacterium]|nr:TonB-dependent receptor [Deltaproteobacteria bacterium]